MAEAFVEDLNIPDESRKTISVLLLGTKWQLDTYGLSTVNKSLVNNLRLVDPEGKTIKITCAVVEDNGKIKDEDLVDAEKHGVKLRGAQRPRSKKRGKKPKLQWLDEDAVKYYLHLVQERKYDFIIGHAPYMANGCLNLKGFYENKSKSPKTLLFFHALPIDENGDVDNEILLDWLIEADLIFSLGKRIEDELLPYVASLDPQEKPIHNLYLPSYPLELFAVQQDNIQEKLKGTQNVSMMSGEIKDLDISGLDFRLAVTAAAGASSHIRDFNDVRINLSLMPAEEGEKVKWKETFEEVIHRKDLNETGLSFQAEAPLTIDKIKIHMRKSNLFLLPLKSDSPLFGTEALAAIAAGVPILVSRYSGLASLLRDMQQDEPVVPKGEFEIWKERIVQTLIKPDRSRQRADKLRKEFLLDTSISKSHLDFINTIADSACIQLEMDIQTDSIVSEKTIEAGIKFGVVFSNPVDAKTYTTAFMKRLLLHREKIGKNLLEAHLDPTIAKLWQEVLSSLEETNRKVTNLQSGSLIFTLFCPKNNSLLQLQDEIWKIELQAKVDKLLNALGVVAQSQIRIKEPFQPQLLQTRDKTKITDSEDQSSGIDTMTVLSDSDSMILQSDKVIGWLSQQHDVKSGDDDQSMTLLETWIIDHVEPPKGQHYPGNRFTVSESGAVGISCFEKPSLSVMYPDTNKPPVILSDTTIYRSATFMKISGKEYLAAAGSEDGCLYLWDTESKTSRKVFDPKLPVEQSNKTMNIFKIGKDIIGYGAEYVSPDGRSNVFILQTDKEEVTVFSTMRIFTKNKTWDMCYTEVDGGAPCLLLCVTNDNRIMLVEMVDGKTRWEAGKQQMGEKFKPFTICTDQKDTVYVADFGQTTIHLLSTSDGVVLKRFDVGSCYGIKNIITLRFHDEYLYVEHKVPKSKYAISRFKESDERQ